MIDEFSQQISECATMDALSETFRAAVSLHGYTASSGRAFAPCESGARSQVLFRNWPKDWAALTDKNGFTAKSMVVTEARRRMAPFSWRDIQVARRSLPAEQELWDNAHAFGWRNGFVMPVHGPAGYFAIVSMASPERDLDLRPERRTQLQLMAMLAHERCCVLANLASPVSALDTMSARELECLRWVAAGKTDWEIGMILSISAATVKFHVNGARAKLGAANRAQAVARLVLSGLY